jgi:hypothetical protein
LSFAQKKDAMLWTGVGAEMSITKKFNIELESQTRFDNNMSQLQSVYGELGGSYKLMKGLRAGVVYRYARKNSGEYYYNENRICTDIKYKIKTDFGLSIGSRLRYQHSFDRLSEVNNILPSTKDVVRLSLKLSYKIDGFKRAQPFLAGELFHAIQPINYYSGFLDTYRIKAGVSLDLPKKHAVKIYYMYEHEYRASDNNNHIYCIQYNYTLPSLYKMKKDDTLVD